MQYNHETNRNNRKFENVMNERVIKEQSLKNEVFYVKINIEKNNLGNQLVC